MDDADLKTRTEQDTYFHAILCKLLTCYPAICELQLMIENDPCIAEHWGHMAAECSETVRVIYRYTKPGVDTDSSAISKEARYGVVTHRKNRPEYTDMLEILLQHRKLAFSQEVCTQRSCDTDIIELFLSQLGSWRNVVKHAHDQVFGHAVVTQTAKVDGKQDDLLLAVMLGWWHANYMYKLWLNMF